MADVLRVRCMQPWNWRCVDGSGYFPLKEPGDEDPFGGAGGAERASQFSSCLGVRDHLILSAYVLKFCRHLVWSVRCEAFW